MKLAGVPERIEIKPENDDERAAFQRIIDGTKPWDLHSLMAWWGDSDEFTGGALIISMAVPPDVDSDVPLAGSSTG